MPLLTWKLKACCVWFWGLCSVFLAASSSCIKAQSQDDQVIDRRVEPGAKDKNQNTPPRPPRDSSNSPDTSNQEALPPPRKPNRQSPAVPVGTKTDVELFQKAHFYYNNDQDQSRRQTFDVGIPVENGPFRKIVLNTRLHCPQPACDAWDRVGSLGIETPEGVPIELHRFVTPYGVGVRMSVDITSFAPILQEKTRFWVEIDTWSGPQRDGGRHGGGWLFDAQLVLETGTPEKTPLEVIPLLNRQYITYGRPRENPNRSGSINWPLDPHSRDPIPSPLHASVHLLITGHGQGNTQNCAEFCPKNHFFRLGGGAEVQKNIWRTNCAETTTDGRQRGTYQYSRAGWCPGAAVTPWWTDMVVPETLQNGSSLDFAYRPESYINQADGGYNDQGHTLPQFLVSGALIIFQP